VTQEEARRWAAGGRGLPGGDARGGGQRCQEMMAARARRVQPGPGIPGGDPAWQPLPGSFSWAEWGCSFPSPPGHPGGPADPQDQAGAVMGANPAGLPMGGWGRGAAPHPPAGSGLAQLWQ